MVKSTLAAWRKFLMWWGLSTGLGCVWCLWWVSSSFSSFGGWRCAVLRDGWVTRSRTEFESPTVTAERICCVMRRESMHGCVPQVQIGGHCKRWAFGWVPVTVVVVWPT